MPLLFRLWILRVVVVDEGHIESRCPVARELDVLDLVFAHGNNVRAKSENVRGHEHGIRE